MSKTTKLCITGIMLGAAMLAFTSCGGKKYTETVKGSIHIVTQKGGPTLGYSDSSGVKLIEDKGYAFKDLNKNGKLDKYEDWRLTADERAKDLASQLSLDEIAGLMLYSAHQMIPAVSMGYFGPATYNGKPFDQSGADTAALSDQQKKFLTEDNLRHVLVVTVPNARIAARWNNNVQTLCEGIGHGIPANNSSDPRNGTTVLAEFNAGNGGSISMWPEPLGLAATFDPNLVLNFGKIASEEYRALGIATALSPQVDMATDPRWWRFSGTFGEDADLSTDMARAYCDGFQTSEGKYEIQDGWGFHSVNAMVKHWPGGGSGEGGRDAHFAYGKYAVYPGNNFEQMKQPFVEGAFKLQGGTKMAAAVMPYYTISFGQSPDSVNVGNSYNKWIITDQLRNKYSFDGVVCTDWNVTHDETDFGSIVSGKCWGMEKATVAERHYRLIMAGVDQFGGNNDKGPILEAYQMGVKALGEKAMRARMEQSAVRLLKNIFRVGLFENPYLDPEESMKIVGNPEFMKAGYEAQVKSIVMLKNKANVLPADKKLKVYIPTRHVPAMPSLFGAPVPGHDEKAIPSELVAKYYTEVTDPKEADFAIVCIQEPNTGTGYDAAHKQYIPISLQYNDYTAVNARPVSLAGGDPTEASANRSYKGKSTKAYNKSDMQLVIDTKKAMGNKPVIVSVSATRPMIFSEIEPYADAILLNFGVQIQAVLDLISGKAEPSALLPCQMPADMKTVEEQKEDMPRDMKCFTDSEGHAYDFAYGMNWKGVIKDERVTKYFK